MRSNFELIKMLNYLEVLIIANENFIDCYLKNNNC